MGDAIIPYDPESGMPITESEALNLSSRDSVVRDKAGDGKEDVKDENKMSDSAPALNLRTTCIILAILHISAAVLSWIVAFLSYSSYYYSKGGAENEYYIWVPLVAFRKYFYDTSNTTKPYQADVGLNFFFHTFTGVIPGVCLIMSIITPRYDTSLGAFLAISFGTGLTCVEYLLWLVIKLVYEDRFWYHILVKTACMAEEMAFRFYSLICCYRLWYEVGTARGWARNHSVVSFHSTQPNSLLNNDHEGMTPVESLGGRSGVEMARMASGSHSSGELLGNRSPNTSRNAVSRKLSGTGITRPMPIKFLNAVAPVLTLRNSCLTLGAIYIGAYCLCLLTAFTNAYYFAQKDYRIYTALTWIPLCKFEYYSEESFDPADIWLNIIVDSGVTFLPGACLLSSIVVSHVHFCVMATGTIGITIIVSVVDYIISGAQMFHRAYNYWPELVAFLVMLTEEQGLRVYAFLCAYKWWKRVQELSNIPPVTETTRGIATPSLNHEASTAVSELVSHIESSEIRVS